jgi:hypothetical protein
VGSQLVHNRCAQITMRLEHVNHGSKVVAGTGVQWISRATNRFSEVMQSLLGKSGGRDARIGRIISTGSCLVK